MATLSFHVLFINGKAFLKTMANIKILWNFLQKRVMESEVQIRTIHLTPLQTKLGFMKQFVKAL